MGPVYQCSIRAGTALQQARSFGRICVGFDTEVAAFADRGLPGQPVAGHRATGGSGAGGA